MLPKINQILMMQVASLDEEEAQLEFKSRIADVTDQHLAIEVPINVKTGRLKRLYPGDELNAYYVTEGGVKNYFNSEVIGIRDDVIRLILIKKPDPASITKVQRRSFLRVPANLEVAVKLNEGGRLLVVTEDVGGGGISFFCDGNAPIEEQSMIECWLLLPFKNGTIDHAFFKGQIVRVKKLESGAKIAMVSYADITDVERQKVIRYCFERQLDFRKR